MQSAIEILQAAGISNPRRVVRLIRQTIETQELDLSGLTVLTEAASGPYVVTPIIAALAGAKRVIALTQDSNYATADEVITQTHALMALCDAPTKKVEIHTTHDLDLFTDADIITNLGFVRPINKSVVNILKPTAVIPLMCEAWEIRPGDVDFEACLARNILVVGTNEDFPAVDVFNYSGWLAQKMLFEAQIENHKSHVLVVSSDKFGIVIHKHLTKTGIQAELRTSLSNLPDLSDFDAIIIADYTRADTIIGKNGDITAKQLSQQAPSTMIIQFAGAINVSELAAHGIAVYPGIENMQGHRMAFTLASLGPRPVIELHTAGLKVGGSLAEALVSKKLSITDAMKYAQQNSPAQFL